MNNSMRAGFAAAVLALLAACGGGGGGGSAGEVVGGSSATAPPPVPESVGSGSVALQGTATFDYVPNVVGKLDYAAVRRRPIRGATVEIVDDQNNAVLARTQTTADGAYAFILPREQRVRLRVRAELKSQGRWDVEVRDNTQGDALYVMETMPFGVAEGALNVHAPSGWSGSAYTSARVAAPFAILDTIYASQSKLLEAEPSAVMPPLAVYWSPDNLPAVGERSRGEIGVSHFNRYDLPASIHLLGQADVDTDEYDESVVAHEWGHYYQWAYSRDDSLGGEHGDEPLEMTVAFSEGWGNAWQGLALGRRDYTDSIGTQQAQVGVVQALDQGGGDVKGWYSERSVAYVIWALGRDAGAAPIHQAMKALRATPAFTSIHAFGAAVRQVAPAAADRLDVLLASQNIVASAASDAFGASETNDAGLGALVPSDTTLLGMPIYLPMPVNAVDANPIQWTLLCSVGLFGSYNKLGVHRAARFEVQEAGTYQIYAQAQEGAGRPYLSLLLGGVRLGSVFPRVSGLTPEFELPKGTAVLALTDERVRRGDEVAACVTAAVFRLK